MQQALVEAARRIAAVLEGASLAASADESQWPEALRRDVHDLVFGALRRFGEGDAILRRLASRPLDAPIRGLLLAALHRLDSRSDSEHVVVDQAVDAAGVLSDGKAGGFVNAVLRNFQRRRAELLAEIGRDSEVIHRHPKWWMRRLQRAWPDDWQRILATGNAPPPISLRVNLQRGSRDDYARRLHDAGVKAETVAEFPAALRLSEATRIDALPGYVDGDFAVQDPGAQLAAVWLDVQPGQRILDACAAPGGKTGHLLELAPSGTLDVLALDVDAQRCQRVEENLRRLGGGELHAMVKPGDAAQPADWWDGQPFDRILADVPCTASGVVRRHPDIKWLRCDADVDRFARTQAALLKALWPLLKPGGKLLYATCSVFPEENHLQIISFNATFPEARLLKEKQLLPSEHHDGFFYALLEKPLA